MTNTAQTYDIRRHKLHSTGRLCSSQGCMNRAETIVSYRKPSQSSGLFFNGVVHTSRKCEACATKAGAGKAAS